MAKGEGGKEKKQKARKEDAEKKSAKKAAPKDLVNESNQQKPEKKKRKRDESQAADAADAKQVGALMEGPPGTASSKPLPLRLLMRHRSVAWQWKVNGKMQYPIPIGSTRPLSPFSSE
eukprot:gnl/TRDRNA2_/TRDRNA2_186717_c0_seq1.p1 gnl/TRDRNA2_/TRDRNA2_186717_c0~~gnl/TRDRNA2_/TRDRNA2_186717_c0_seq1.p1  ORF type:complete len:118 (-),score=39.97 gnl/TRDRNA2_/TRDRNA2_186717_c0_seq1:156-509(-)